MDRCLSSYMRLVKSKYRGHRYVRNNMSARVESGSPYPSSRLLWSIESKLLPQQTILCRQDSCAPVHVCCTRSLIDIVMLCSLAVQCNLCDGKAPGDCLLVSRCRCCCCASQHQKDAEGWQTTNVKTTATGDTSTGDTGVLIYATCARVPITATMRHVCMGGSIV